APQENMSKKGVEATGATVSGPLKIEINIPQLTSLVSDVATLQKSIPKTFENADATHTLRLSNQDWSEIYDLVNYYATLWSLTNGGPQQGKVSTVRQVPTITRDDFDKLIYQLQVIDRSVRDVKKAVDDKRLEVSAPRQIGIFNRATSP
ncbi:MAG TPA: hypothetical protein VGE29_13130, partial [Prosthecobacter sp.]